MTLARLPARNAGVTEYTYIGTRLHPTAGLLLKVGISNDPQRRAKELGLSLHAVLPAWCELDIHRHLKRKRVWRPREWDYAYAGGALTPTFPAPTEWFYIDPALGDWLRTYIAFARETVALLAR